MPEDVVLPDAAAGDTGETAPPSAQTEGVAADSESSSEASSDATDGGNVSKVFTQQDVDRIVEQRLKRQQRVYERRLREIQEKLDSMAQQGGQSAAAPAPDASALNRQFLAEFARDPLGTLRKFANTVVAEQNQNLIQSQRKLQGAAAEAVENLKEKYPDFDRYSTAIAQYVQRSPSLSLALRAAGPNITPELYEDILEQGYQAIRRQAIAQAKAVGDVQVNAENQSEREEKARAAAPRRKPGTPPAAGPQDPADVLFQAMMELGKPGRRK